MAGTKRGRGPKGKGLSGFYYRYLRSEAWKRVRAGALARTQGLCAACPSPATEVHHLTYVRLGAELPSDVIALCDACHRIADSIRKEGKKKR